MTTMVRRVLSPGGGRSPAKWEDVPIASIRAGDLVCSYDAGKSHYRVTGSRVEAVRRLKHVGPMIHVRTTSGLETSYTPRHHVVTWIGDAFDEKHVVYMMRRGDDYRIGRCGWRYGKDNSVSGPYMRARSEGADAFWVLSVHDTMADAATAEQMAQFEWQVPGACFARHGVGGMDCDAFWAKYGNNIPAAMRALEAHGRDIRHPLWVEGTRLLQRRSIVTAAANLMDGMKVLPADNCRKHSSRRARAGTATMTEAITVTRSHFDDYVISLTVEGDHTYVGDGIITHNSWNGAVDALDKFGIEDVAWLTQSFRFGPAVAEVANQVLEQLGAQLRLTGFEPRESVVTAVRDGRFTLLGRTNALVVSNALNDIRAGRKVHIVGGAKDVISFADAAAKLKAGKTTWHHDLACFSTWGEAQDYAENDPMGEDLKLLVRLVDQYGAETLATVLKDQCPEKDAEALYSTAHKAKGREWDRVRIGSDFTDPEKKEISDEEKRLTYVAVTRAMQELDVADVPLLNQKREAA